MMIIQLVHVEITFAKFGRQPLHHFYGNQK